MAYNQDIQLLPETRKRIDVKSPGENRILVIGILVLICIIGIGFYFKLNSRSIENKIKSVDADLVALESKRDLAFENNILILKQQLGLISGYVDNHLYWTKVLSKLENLLQTKVQLTRVDFQKQEISEDVSIGGKTINYAALAKQMAAFLSDSAITDIDLQGAETRSSGIVEFNMKIKVNPTALHNNDK